MGEVTTIAWTDHTFNPWVGCTRVSEGCRHCYAEAQDQRWKGGVHWGPGAPRQPTSPENWHLPLRWNESAKFRRVREKVFCLSLGDWADEEVPDEWRSWLFTLISACDWLDWQLLTKRTARARSLLRRLHWVDGVAKFAAPQYEGDSRFCADPLPNVWIGTTVEDQKSANERIPLLMQTPAAVRFLSCEPLLEPLTLWKLPVPYYEPGHSVGREVYPLAGMFAIPDCDWPAPRIDWVIIGGESGAHARPFRLEWARGIVEQCRYDGVPVFVKQLGACPQVDVGTVGMKRPNGSTELVPGVVAKWRPKDPKGGDMAEWPPDLRIRQFPEVRR